MLEKPEGDRSAVDRGPKARILVRSDRRAVPVVLLSTLSLTSVLLISFGFRLLDDPRAGVGPAVVLFLAGLLGGWTTWKITHTVREVTETAEGVYAFTALTKRWWIRPENIVAVKGDAYGIFLVVVTPSARICLWSRRESRRQLVRELARVNPTIEFDRYVDPWR